MLFRLLIQVIQLQKTDYNTKINETEKKITDHDHDKYITIQEFDKLKSENYLAAFVEKTDFDDKQKKFNKNVEAEMKITNLTNKVPYYQIAMKKLLPRYRPEYHPKILDHQILTLNRQCLIQSMVEYLKI